MPRTEANRIKEVRRAIDRASAESQYGWGHSIDFGPFTQEGFLGETWLAVAGALDQTEMWPLDLSGMRVADVGAFTGGISALMAGRGAEIVYAVDELPGHAEQARVVADAFGFPNMRVIESSLFRLDRHIAPDTLDLILLSGVLYHLSDMLVGLYGLRRLLKPGGRLVLETNAVEDMSHSYANFGRNYAGMWWQPTMLCVQDMCEFMGFEKIRVEPFVDSRCITTAVRAAGDIPFKRGLNWDFESRDDATDRPLDMRVMAPAAVTPDSDSNGLSPVQRLAKRLLRIP
jgi:SAM-dependent methyltransferase